MKPVRIVAFLAALAFPGCAVLQIDVDVYKGPLANHEQVQVHQLGAMAIAARPLLVSLRDKLAAKHVAEQVHRRRLASLDAKALQEALAAGLAHVERNCPMRAATVVRDSGGNCRMGDDAERVNAVLTLYDDAEETRIMAAAALYRAALDRLDRRSPAARRADRHRWEEISAGLKAEFVGREFFDSYCAVATDHEQEKGKWSAAQKLIGAYRILLDSSCRSHETWRGQRLPWAVKQYIAANQAALTARFGAKSLAAAQFRTIPADEKAQHSATAFYADIQDAQRVGFHAAFLFEHPDGPEAKRFVDAAQDMGAAYTVGRRSLQRLLEAVLDAAIAADEVVLPGERTSNELATAIGALVQPEYVVAASCIASNEVSDALVRHIPKVQERRTAESWHSEVQTAGSDTRSAYRESVRLVVDDIKRAAGEDMRKTAILLRRAHDAVLAGGGHPVFDQGRSGCAGLGAENFWGVDAEKLSHGIARGPSLDSRMVRAHADSFRLADVTAVSSEVGLGLERGRPPEGLATLLDAYVTASRSTDKVEQEQALSRLSYALVQYAEKLLFIANNDYILKDNDGLYPKVIDSYVLGLQAIGNHIMVAANELRERDAHKQRQRERAPVQRAAIRGAVPLSPARLIDHVVAGLRAETGQASASAGTNRAELKRLGYSDAATAQSEIQQRKPAAEQRLATAKAELEAAKGSGPATASQPSLKHILDAYAVLEQPLYRGSLRSLVAGNAGEQVARKAFLAEVVTWSSEPTKVDVDAAVKPGPDAERLKAHEYFKREHDAVADGDTATASRSTRFDALLERLQRSAGLAKARILELEQAVERAETAVARLDVVLQTANDVSRDDANSGKYVKAADLLAKASSDIEAEIRKAKTDQAPTAAWMVIQAQATARAADDKIAADEKASWATVAAYLKDRTPPPARDLSEMGDLLGSGDTADESAREVFDRLIRLFEAEHLLATRERGKDDARSVALANAIKAAYDQRAGMAYIRPPSAYLRSSNAATLLQEDPGLQWENMLAGPARRSIPFIGSALERHADGADRLRIAADIDKQYWQNINRVRVSGGGRTNYAVVKDDLGNWYVKGYSSDTQDIIKSMKNFALFNVGAKLGSNLLPPAPRIGADGKPLAAGGVNSDAERNALERAFDNFKRGYVEATAKHYGRAKTLLGTGDGSAASIAKAAVQASQLTAKPAATDLVDKAQSDQLKPILDEADKAETAGTASAQPGLVIDALRALVRFRKQVANGMKGLNGETGARVAVDIEKALNEKIKDLAEARRATAGKFATETLVLSEATKEPSAPATPNVGPAGGR